MKGENMGQKKFNHFIKKTFSKGSKFISGGEINKILQNEFEIKEGYARQIIRRAVKSGVINSSKPISFDKGQYIYFNQNNSLNIDVLEDISKKYRPPLYRLIKMLKINDGIISYYEALKITSSPLDKHKTKKSHLDDQLDILSELDLIEFETDRKKVKYIILKSFSYDSLQELISSHYTKMVLDSLFLPDILNWLRKINLIDNSNIRFRNKNCPSLGTKHNNFVWDAYAYTKTTGINTITESNNDNNDKSVLVVLEVIISRKFTDLDLQCFYDRIQGVRNSVKHKSNTRKVIPIIIYKEISSEAFNKMKALGFLGFNLGVIFGENIYEIIEEIYYIKLKENDFLDESKEVVDEINRVLTSIEQSGQKPNLGQIKGDLFESLIYSLLREIYSSGVIEQNKRIPKKDNEDEYYEFDFIITHPGYDELIVIEVKGKSSRLVIEKGPYDKKETIQWFFNNTFPRAKEWLEEDERKNYTVKASYITTANIRYEAKEYLNKTFVGKSLQSKKLDIYYDGEKLFNLLDQEGLDNIKRTLKRHYIENY